MALRQTALIIGVTTVTLFFPLWYMNTVLYGEKRSAFDSWWFAGGLALMFGTTVSLAWTPDVLSWSLGAPLTADIAFALIVLGAYGVFLLASTGVSVYALLTTASNGG